MDTTQHAESQCPFCSHKLDASSGDGAPQAGDVTLCIECGRVLIFNADMTIRAPTEDEQAEISLDEEQMQEIGRIRLAIERANRMS